MRKLSSSKVGTTLLLASLIASACQQSGESSGTSAAKQRQPLSDSEVMAMIYDPTYRVPDGFFVDDRADTARSYSLHHINDPSDSFERCTDEFDTAYDWESADNESRAVQGVYVGSIETDRYFEFVRELSFTDDIGNVGELTSPGFARVFKCGYVSRDGVDRHLRNGYAGRLTVRPLDPGSVAEFVQYLWNFAFFWPAKAVVLATYSEGDAVTLTHTLLLGLRHNQGSETCDSIELIDWAFAVNRQDGSVSKSYRRLREFKAHLIDGRPERCTD